MNAPISQLKPKQLRAVAALVRHGGELDKAAAEAGVSQRTLRRWRSSPAFRAASTEVAKAAMADALQQLQALAATAVGKLAEAMTATGDVPKSRWLAYQAACSVLDHASKAYEATHLDERLTAIEALLEGQGKGSWQ